MDIPKIPTHMHPVATLATAMCYRTKKRKKKTKALPLIRRGPLKVLGCILTLQDLEQLQVLSSCLTNSPLHYGLLADTLPQPFPLSHRC